MRISHWSSDVCSSDLIAFHPREISSMARGMAYLSPRLASAAALLLPLTLAATPALAQTAPTHVKEDSVVLQPAQVADDAPVLDTLAPAYLPSRSEDHARALLTFIPTVGQALRSASVTGSVSQSVYISGDA